LREAARHGTATSPDARHPQPLLALAALVDARDLEEADRVLHAADTPASRKIPAGTALALHLARRPIAGPQFAELYARTETTTAEAQITEARDGPAVALSRLRRLRADLQARPGLLLAGDPAVAAWLVRTALAAGDRELAAIAGRSTQALSEAHPGFPALAAAAAHSRGLVRCDPAPLA